MCRDSLGCSIEALTNLPEHEFILLVSLVMVGLGIAAFIALQLLEAPYGRYNQGAEQKSILFGLPMDGRVAWFLQEIPCVAWVIFGAYTSDPIAFQWQNKVLLGAFALHYFNRAIIFPLRIASNKPTPFLVFLMAFVFCFVNGYLQVRDLTQYHAMHQADEGRMWVGLLVFFIGMYINIDSDSILRNLRRGPQDAGKYFVPRGGMFDFVSGANFFGEIVEWTGFAIAAGSVPSAAFACFTASNIGPRAVQHHRDYRKRFNGKEDMEMYPPERKALVPFVL